MGVWSSFVRLWCYGVLLSTIFTIAFLIGVVTLVVGPLHHEYSMHNPNSASAAWAQLERILFPEQRQVQQLTTFNYQELLQLDGAQLHSTKNDLHQWIFVQGHDPITGQDSAFGRAFDSLVERYYVRSPAHDASIFRLSCDDSPFLCAAWAIQPPGLVRLESESECDVIMAATDDFKGPTSLACPYRARWIPLPFQSLFEHLPKTRAFVDETLQLRTLIEGEAFYEVVEEQRLLGLVGLEESQDAGALEVMGEMVAAWPTAALLRHGFDWWYRQGSFESPQWDV